MKKQLRVMVAMSGGVDSSVAALLLKNKGFEVVGVTMCLGLDGEGGRKPVCCGTTAIADAKRVCEKLGIPHYVLDFSDELENKVIRKFVAEYQKGRTPNPCVDCNAFLKFRTLLNKAVASGFDFLVTGHYARVVKKGRDYFLKNARDKIKNQTYFLYGIKKENLKKILFPLAGLTKAAVRALAKKHHLPVADKAESQDICFIPSGDRSELFRKRLKNIQEGKIVDCQGEILGQHRGLVFYTIGQRSGLGISHPTPLYVIAIDAVKNQLVVGEKKDLLSGGLVAGNLNLFTKNFRGKIFAKIRYAHQPARCKVFLKNDKLKIIFSAPQPAVTPGQSVVLYRGDLVLGGGVIEKSLKLKAPARGGSAFGGKN